MPAPVGQTARPFMCGMYRGPSGALSLEDGYNRRSWELFTYGTHGCAGWAGVSPGGEKKKGGDCGYSGQSYLQSWQGRSTRTDAADAALDQQQAYAWYMGLVR